MATPPGPDPPALALVGRDREQATLHAALAATLAGHGSLVLLGGEAGVGKTALAEALCAEAQEQGTLVLVGRCYDLAETPPYGPWVEALAARTPDTDGSLAPPDLAGGGVASQAALFAAVRDHLAARAKRQPLVLLLDDLHWADPASLDLLRALARGLAALPLLLLAIYRSDELTRRHPLYQLLPTLERESRTTRLDLHPLGANALRALAGRYALPVGDADRLGAWLLGRAEGNAFFTAQLLRALEETGALRHGAEGWALGDLATVGLPAPLRQVLDARLARLGEEGLRLLTLAAVIGQAVPLALWAAVAGTDEEGLLDAIDAAGEAHLVVVDPGGGAVRFAHALIREALYEGLVATRRRRVHRRVADALVATASPEPDAVAYHLQRAGDAWAAIWLVRAGDRAERAYAWLTATARFEAALALQEGGEFSDDERGWTLVRLAALRRLDNPSQALAHLQDAEDAIAAAADPLLGPYALLVAGLARCNAGAATRGIAELETGVARLEALPAAARADLGRVPLVVRQALDDDGVGTLVLRQSLIGHLLVARPRGEQVIAATPGRTAGRPADPPRADAYAGLTWVYWVLGQSDAAMTSVRRASAEYRAAGHYYLFASTFRVQLDMHWRHFAEARADRARLIADLLSAVALSSEMPGRSVADYLSRTLLLEGRWNELRPPQSLMHDWSVVQWTELARYRGDAARGWAMIGQFFAHGAATPPGDVNFILAVELQQIAVALALDTGDLDAAREWLAAHDRWLAWADAVLGQTEGQALWARYHRQMGDHARAYRHAQRALDHATEPRQPLALLVAHRLLGELEAAAGRYVDAQGHLDDALALADACAVPYERALTLLALAELRADERRIGAATDLLARARALLEPLEARPALARVDALAARLAAPAPSLLPPSPPVPFGLTARELEILKLVAEGLGNVAIADRLSLSRRTVEQHLRSVYDKLGVENRTAAARVAVERGLA